MDYEHFELANKLRVFVAPMRHVKSVSTALFMGVGSRYETDGEAGIAHLVEHLMFKGTHRRPSSKLISEPIERVGGVMNASTDKEATVYWTKTAAEHLAVSIDLLADMLLHSRLTPRDVDREKSVIVEELAMSMDDPQEWVHNLIDQSMWPDQPIGRDVGGTRESVLGITRNGIRAFLATHYVPTSAVLVVAGGVTVDEVRTMVDSAFGEWTGSGISDYAPGCISDGPSGRVEVRPTEQTHFCLAFPGRSRLSPERFALDILVSILGGGPTSRLFLEVRERLGLTYDVHAYTTRYADTGSVVAYAGVDSRRAGYAVTAIKAEVQRLRKRVVAADDLVRTIEYMKGRMYLGLEDTHAVASWLGTQALLMDRIMTPEELTAVIEQVTPKQVRAQAVELLDTTHMHVAAIGPSAEQVLEVAFS